MSEINKILLRNANNEAWKTAPWSRESVCQTPTKMAATRAINSMLNIMINNAKLFSRLFTIVKFKNLAKAKYKTKKNNSDAKIPTISILALILSSILKVHHVKCLINYIHIQGQMSKNARCYVLPIPVSKT